MSKEVLDLEDLLQVHDYVFEEEDETPEATPPLVVKVEVDGLGVDAMFSGPNAESIVAALRLLGADDYLAALTAQLENL